MLLPRDYSFKYLKTTFECHLEHKFNFIISDAACGKTWLQKQILKSGNDGEIQILYPQMHRIDFTKTYDNIWFIDECDLLPILKKVGVGNFIKSPNVFLIVSRNIPVSIPVDYRAVFNWIAKDRHYTIKRVYEDYRQFPVTARYHCEDSNSGFEYFNSHLKHVTTLQGRDNVFNILYDKDDTIIADGAAFAQTLRLVKLREIQAQLFLPDSFEGLVCENLPSAKHIVLDSHTDTVLPYISIEAYYTDQLKKLFNGYSKKHCPSYIKDLDLIRQTINHYGITPVIAKRYNIDYNNENACKKLSEQLSKNL